ncbi:hypothetical protein DQ353_12895 [Arthrobacter sp. AQ5-05]|uniref:hypothetical protein n=1 Tax=Arthrobacter sp. AQ5-05 TaxID=2184581 RepID=UPI000DCEFAC6|nr:hypothetical protein [Arthrobacter sp. AQ5-05]RAX48825.1 hypothetical protein DQ353_12895 [Arthrobacter sp. AQ5-05]
MPEAPYGTTRPTRENLQPVVNRMWRYVPVACAASMLLVVGVVDPAMAGAPWWELDEEGLWVALALPLAPWFICSALAVLVGFTTGSRTAIVLMSLLSLASGIIPALIWTLLLHDVFPDSGSLRLSTAVPALAGAALPALLIGLGLRHTVRAARRLGAA